MPFPLPLTTPRELSSSLPPIVLYVPRPVKRIKLRGLASGIRIQQLNQFREFSGREETRQESAAPAPGKRTKLL
jgi:hypothetical protein